MGKLNYANLPKLVSAIDTVRQLNPEFPPQALLCFLAVATAEGDITIEDIALRLGVHKSVASRNVRYLSSVREDGSPGHGLIESGPHPTKWRYKTVRLTDTGRKLAGKLEKLL